MFIVNFQNNIETRIQQLNINNIPLDFTPRSYKLSIQEIDNLLRKGEFFQTSYKLLVQNNHNLETSFECIGHLYNQSCLFKNLYYNKGTFWILTTKKMAFPLPDVRIGGFIMSQFTPNRRRFYTYADLEDFVIHRINPIVIPNTTVYFDQPWLSNIGHALFDGLYPAYLSLIRFQPKHLQPFRILLSTMSDSGNIAFTQDVYNVFAGLNTINLSLLETLSLERWFVFQEIVMGSGNMCQRCLQPNLQLPGGIELNGSRLFRDRMYVRHGLSPPTIKQSDPYQEQNIMKPLIAYVIDNKRFNNDDKIEIKAAIDEINKYTKAYMQQTVEHGESFKWPPVHVSYISYTFIEVSEKIIIEYNTNPIKSKKMMSKSKMKTHLQLLQNMNIHITGPGTGQMYQTFLSDGSVNINLGGLNYKKKENIVSNYTSFLEQYVTAGTPYIRGLYYPINERTAGIKREVVIRLIRNAAELIRNRFMIPVNSKHNLASDGQLFTELCELDQDFCMTVTERSEKNKFWCIDTWPEDIIHESGPWSSEGIVEGNKTIICPCNRTLIERLRRKYNINDV